MSRLCSVPCLNLTTWSLISSLYLTFGNTREKTKQFYMKIGGEKKSCYLSIMSQLRAVAEKLIHMVRSIYRMLNENTQKFEHKLFNRSFFHGCCSRGGVQLLVSPPVPVLGKMFCRPCFLTMNFPFIQTPNKCIYVSRSCKKIIASLWRENSSCDLKTELCTRV